MPSANRTVSSPALAAVEAQERIAIPAPNLTSSRGRSPRPMERCLRAAKNTPAVADVCWPSRMPHGIRSLGVSRRTGVVAQRCSCADVSVTLRCQLGWMRTSTHQPRRCFAKGSRPQSRCARQLRVNRAVDDAPVRPSAGMYAAKLRHSVSYEFWASSKRRVMTEVHMRISQFKGNRVSRQT